MSDQFASGLAKFKIELPDGAAEKSLLFIDELLRWNKRVNLTSINNRDEALEKHILDSLILLNYLPRNGRLLDMGSGGGLPGIPLAIACPGLRVVSVDSVGKKISFQKHIKRFLSLDNLLPVHSRIEKIENQEPFDFVVARALSSFSALVDLSAPHLKEGGLMYVMKGPEGAVELEQYTANCGDKRYKVRDVHCYQLPNSYSERQLFVLVRTSSSPVIQRQ